MAQLTEDQFILMVGELMDRSKEDAIQKARSVWHSGAIDKEQYEDNYILPKLFLVAYSSEIKRSWSPWNPDKKYSREIKNLERFI